MMNDFEITWAQLTPSLSLIIRPAQVPNLKTLVVADEAVVPEVIRTWGLATDLIIGIMVASSCYVVESANSNKLVPIVGIGELLISGPLLSRGCLRAPDHITTSFTMGPSWSDDKTKRSYCTGDLVKLLLDGNLLFLSRKNN
jgi:non-ribosomal peptide synthetase component F